jgi:hypothetical protein
MSKPETENPLWNLLYNLGFNWLTAITYAKNNTNNESTIMGKKKVIY